MNLDAYTISTKRISQLAEICPLTIRNAERYETITKGTRKPGIRGKWWTPAEANKFLKRRGHTGPWFE